MAEILHEITDDDKYGINHDSKLGVSIISKVNSFGFFCRKKTTKYLEEIFCVLQNDLPGQELRFKLNTGKEETGMLDLDNVAGYIDKMLDLENGNVRRSITVEIEGGSFVHFSLDIAEKNRGLGPIPLQESVLYLRAPSEESFVKYIEILNVYIVCKHTKGALPSIYGLDVSIRVKEHVFQNPTYADLIPLFFKQSIVYKKVFYTKREIKKDFLLRLRALKYQRNGGVLVYSKNLMSSTMIPLIYLREEQVLKSIRLDRIQYLYFTSAQGIVKLQVMPYRENQIILGSNIPESQIINMNTGIVAMDLLATGMLLNEEFGRYVNDFVESEHGQDFAEVSLGVFSSGMAFYLGFDNFHLPMSRATTFIFIKHADYHIKNYAIEYSPSYMSDRGSSLVVDLSYGLALSYMSYSPYYTIAVYATSAFSKYIEVEYDPTSMLVTALLLGAGTAYLNPEVSFYGIASASIYGMYASYIANAVAEIIIEKVVDTIGDTEDIPCHVD